MQALKLVKLRFLYNFHYFRANLANEIVTAICGAAIFALFLYITQDFLGAELKNASLAVWKSISSSVAMVFYLSAASYFGWQLAASHSHHDSIVKMAEFFGEQKNTRKHFLLIYGLLFLSSVYALVWYLLSHFVFKFEPDTLIWILLAMGVFTGLFYALQTYSRNRRRPPRSLGNHRSTTISLLKWRLIQLFRQNTLSFVSFALVSGLGIQILYLTYITSPFFIIYLEAFIISIVLTIPIAFQLKADLENSWVEKNSGISHKVFVNTYDKLSSLIGCGIGVCIATSWLLVNLTNNQTVFSFSSLEQWLKLFAVVSSLPLIFPNLMFQIDARRPFLQILSLSLIGLLLMTAIYIHWLSIGIIPVLKYYSETMQKDRFYRA